MNNVFKVYRNSEKNNKITFLPSKPKEPKLKSRDLSQSICKDPMSFEIFYQIYISNINHSYHLHKSYI